MPATGYNRHAARTPSTSFIRAQAGCEATVMSLLDYYY